MRGRITLIILIHVLLMSGGCSSLAPTPPEPRWSGALGELDGYAWRCYEQGLSYLDQARFELARQQFAFAASAAVSRDLYANAVEGYRRADRLIVENR